MIACYHESSDRLNPYKYTDLPMLLCVDLSMLTDITNDQTQISFNLCLCVYLHIIVTKAFQKALCVFDWYQCVQTAAGNMLCFKCVCVCVCVYSYVCMYVCMYVCVYIYIHTSSSSSLVFNPKPGYGRNQSPVRRPVWLWHTAF